MRPLFAVSAVLTVFVAAGIRAQDTPELTPRQVFDEPHPMPQPSPAPRRNVSRPPRQAEPQQAPLVLRYSIQRKNSDGQYDDVDPDTTFHSGDSIRVNLQASDSAYLYIAESGSSGAWKILFPSDDSGNDNRDN